MSTLITAKAQVANVKALLKRMAPDLADATKLIRPEAMARVALSACMKTPKLLECTPASFVGALLRSAELGLPPDGRLAALVPFRNKGKQEATLMPMYMGLAQLAYRGGAKRVFAQVVREADEWSGFVEGEIPRHVRAKPSIGGEVIGAWAAVDDVAWFMWTEEIEAIEKKSPGASKSDSPWRDRAHGRWWMFRKTVLKQCLKLARQSYELSAGLMLDDDADVGRGQDLPVPIDYEDITAESIGAVELVEADEPSDQDIEDAITGIESVGTLDEARRIYGQLSDALRNNERVAEALNKRTQQGD